MFKDLFKNKDVGIGDYTVQSKWLWIGGTGLVILAFVAFGLYNTFFRYNYGYLSSEPGYYSDDSGDYYDEGFGGGADDAIYAEEAEASYDLAESDGDAARAPGSSEGFVDTQSTSNTTANVQPTERLIIRTGNISMEVEDTLATRDTIEALVEDFDAQGAFVVSASQSGSGSSAYVYITVRVPVEHFSAIMDQIAEMGVRVNDRTEYADDVTEEYVDLDGRIEAMETSIQRLLELIEKAETTEALLQAEQQLTWREAEMEGLKGRQNYLGTAARLSTVTINLSPYIVSQPIDTSWDPAKVFRNAIDSLIDNLQDFVEFLIRFVIIGLPALITWIFVLYLAFIALRWVWGKTFARNKTKAKENKPE